MWCISVCTPSRVEAREVKYHALALWLMKRLVREEWFESVIGIRTLIIEYWRLERYNIYITKEREIYMSEDKNINVSVVPKFAETALENVLEAPSKSIGDTFSDIWYLVLGGPIAQAVEKRKMKYAVDLEAYKKKIEEEIEKIPDNKKCEPDVQVTGAILEASKYCAEKEELRNMFAKLIASSMNLDKQDIIHPIFVDIIKRMDNLDAKVLKYIFLKDKYTFSDVSYERMKFCLEILFSLGLIDNLKTNSEIDVPNSFKELLSQLISLGLDVKTSFSEEIIGTFVLTKLGEKFCEVCL